MNTHLPKSLILFLLTGLLFLVACGGNAPATQGSKIEVEGAWARPSPKMAGSGAAYMVLKNSDNKADKLLSVTTSAANVAELHESFMDENEVMNMRPVEGGAIEVPAGGSVALKPGGMHVMLIKLTNPLEEGKTIPLTLNFENSEPMSIDVMVSESPPEK